MRIIPTRTHALLDYLSAALLLVLPSFIEASFTLTIVMMAAGAIILLCSALTEYDLGLIPLIQLRHHFLCDAAVGLFLLALPVVTGQSASLWLLFVIGTSLLVSSVTTELDAFTGRADDRAARVAVRGIRRAIKT